MGIPKDFSSITEAQLHAYAAWLPITNAFRLGDYGLIAEGVFNKIGNIADDFGVNFIEGKGPETSIDFVSADTTVVNTVAGAVVDVVPESAVGVKVTYKFNKARSFLVKAARVKVKTVENVNQLATQLKDRREWERKWRVVRETYHAEDALVLSTIAAGTEVGFNADAKVLKQLHLGDVSANVGVSVNKELGLKLIGKRGVLALGLFKLHWLTGNLDVLTNKDANVEARIDDGTKPLADDV
jgi:hypothetical protein